MAEKLLHALPLFAAWEARIAEGNTAFNQRCDRLAMARYQQALEGAQAIIAEKPWLNAEYTARFEALDIFESALAALIVTFNNITHLRLRQKPLRGVELHVHQAESLSSNCWTIRRCANRCSRSPNGTCCVSGLKPCTCCANTGCRKPASARRRPTLPLPCIKSDTPI